MRGAALWNDPHNSLLVEVDLKLAGLLGALEDCVQTPPRPFIQHLNLAEKKSALRKRSLDACNLTAQCLFHRATAPACLGTLSPRFSHFSSFSSMFLNHTLWPCPRKPMNPLCRRNPG